MRYHLIGIGGVSMSGLAKLLRSQGHSVSGCDLKEIPNDKLSFDKLRTPAGQFPNNYQIPIFKGHDPKHITKNLDAVIVTAAAIHENSPAEKEIERAKSLGLRVMTRSQLIGKLMHDKIGIAIAGMHGKTTVTTMIGRILEEAGFNPTVLVGSDVKEWKGNVCIANRVSPIAYRKSQHDKPLAISNKPEYFVVEACEYDRQMLDFRPKIAVITNLDEEHLDTYPRGMKDIRQAFKKFIKLLPPNGLLVVNQDDKNLMPLIKAAKCKVKTFGKDKIWPGLNLKIPGKHNLLNATAAARVCHELGVEHQMIKEVLNNFSGAARRFEIKGIKDGITIIDDYGHHPTEIKATLQAAREQLEEILSSKSEIRNKFKAQNPKFQTGDQTQKPQPNLIVVFQPHQYTRTKLLFNDFVKTFDGVAKLIITDIYLIAGREPKEARADFSKKLVEEIKKRLSTIRSRQAAVDVEYISGYDKIVARLKEIARKGDIILTLGATDIYKVGEEFLGKIR